MKNYLLLCIFILCFIFVSCTDGKSINTSEFIVDSYIPDYHIVDSDPRENRPVSDFVVGEVFIPSDSTEDVEIEDADEIIDEFDLGDEDCLEWSSSDPVDIKIEWWVTQELLYTQDDIEPLRDDPLEELQINSLSIQVKCLEVFPGGSHVTYEDQLGLLPEFDFSSLFFELKLPQGVLRQSKSCVMNITVLCEDDSECGSGVELSSFEPLEATVIGEIFFGNTHPSHLAEVRGPFWGADDSFYRPGWYLPVCGE